MRTLPKVSAYSLGNVGRQSAGLEVRTRSPPSLVYFAHMCGLLSYGDGLGYYSLGSVSSKPVGTYHKFIN